MTSTPCVVLVDKPVGSTSFAIVRAARRGVTGRVGHAGTLDPFASGLLLVMVGQATKVSSLLMGLPKEYDLTIQFGAASTTADPTGEITRTGTRVSAEQVVAAMDGFRGCIRQRVPLTSAVKVNGEPLYKKAHRGESAETPEREIMIYDLDLLEFDAGAQTARVLVLSGSGAYMRTLAEDIGAATGAGAYAAALRRTRVGRFDVESAVGPEELSPALYAGDHSAVQSLDEALAFLPRRDLSGDQARLATHGNTLQVDDAGRFRAWGPEGLLGVYEALGGVARPLLVLSGSA